MAAVRSDNCTKSAGKITLDDLTPRQCQCLEWLYFWTEVEPQKIAITRVSKAMGMLSHHGAKWHVERLIKYGLATRTPGMMGTVRPTPSGLKLGRLSANRYGTESEMRAAARRKKRAKK